MELDIFRAIFADINSWLFMTIPPINGYQKAAARFDRLQDNHHSATHKLRRGEIVHFAHADWAAYCLHFKQN